MKTSILIALLAAAIVAHAGDQTPVVVPVRGGGTATMSQFGNGIITRGDGGSSSITTTFGTGFITRPGTTGAMVNQPATSNVIILPARK